MSNRHFDQGWRDRLRELPPRASYEKMRTLPRVQYERGRHIAMLWKFYVETELKRGYVFGTIHKRENAMRWTYAEAFPLMPPELQRAVYAEERFCSLQSEILSVK